MPVSTFRIVMLTPGTMAPVESVTVPRIVAVVTCADIGLNPAINHSRIAPSSLLDTVIKASSDTPREKARHRLSNARCRAPETPFWAKLYMGRIDETRVGLRFFAALSRRLERIKGGLTAPTGE